jgi:hypothetical protein
MGGRKKIQLPRHQERQKETQSHNALFCTVEREDGQAQEGDHETEHQRKEIFS